MLEIQSGYSLNHSLLEEKMKVIEANLMVINHEFIINTCKLMATTLHL